MGTGDCGVMASGARVCHQALTGWQCPRCDQISQQDASSVSCTRAFGGSPRRIRSRWAYGVARTGETDPSAQGDVRKTLRSQRTKHQNATHELRLVTSAHAPWLEVERHQDDTLIGIARVDPKIRLTTLLNCTGSVRPVRAKDLSEIACAPPPFQCPAKSGRFREPPARSQNDLRGVCRSDVRYAM